MSKKRKKRTINDVEPKPAMSALCADLQSLHRYRTWYLQNRIAFSNKIVAAVAIENAELDLRARSAEEALTSRKLIERAKDILSQEANILPSEAYRLIQKQSMDSRKSMREIAEAIILARDIKEKQ